MLLALAFTRSCPAVPFYNYTLFPKSFCWILPPLSPPPHILPLPPPPSLSSRTSSLTANPGIGFQDNNTAPPQQTLYTPSNNRYSGMASEGNNNYSSLGGTSPWLEKQVSGNRRTKKIVRPFPRRRGGHSKEEWVGCWGQVLALCQVMFECVAPSRRTDSPHLCRSLVRSSVSWPS